MLLVDRTLCFVQHYSAVMKYISQGPMLLDVHMHRPHTTSRNFMDALLAFWPGLQVSIVIFGLYQTVLELWLYGLEIVDGEPDTDKPVTTLLNM